MAAQRYARDIPAWNRFFLSSVLNSSSALPRLQGIDRPSSIKSSAATRPFRHSHGSKIALNRVPVGGGRQETSLDEKKAETQSFRLFFNYLWTLMVSIDENLGAGNESCARTLSRCFQNTFFAEVVSEDLNCSPVFRPRQQTYSSTSKNVQRASIYLLRAATHPYRLISLSNAIRRSTM